MNSTRFTCVVLLTLAGAALAAAQEPFPDDVLHSAPLFLQEIFGEGDAAMVIALVDQRGSRVFAAGKLDNGSDRRVDGDTLFEIGSVTKVFTVLLLLDAVRRGEVNLDDPLAKHLPQDVQVPSYDGKIITLLNLAVQDSGLPFFPDNLGDKPVDKMSLGEIKKFSDEYTIDKLYGFLTKHKLTMAPGTRFEYSNVGMALLGKAIERRTGSDYESLITDRICRPLELSDTCITPTEEMQTRLATGHLADGARAEHWRLQAMAGAGAMLSTANDLAKFLAANLGFTQSHLTPLLETMQVSRHTGSAILGNSAMPWVDERVYHPPGSELLGHAGGGYGTIAFIAFDKKKRRGVVVLTNQMKVYPNGVGWTILQGRPLSQDNTPIREVVGVGIALEIDEPAGLPRISAVFPQSPAGQASLAVGIVIRRINGESLEGKSLNECIAMLGGDINTTVRLELFNPDQEETSSIELTRKKFLTVKGEARPSP
jgi:CubicO group peptidase (beta-lactamase class C family)